MLYIEDPHELYKHWPADVWDAIERHEVKPGMNEIQADFAVGMGIPQRSDDPTVKTVNYPNGGNLSVLHIETVRRQRLALDHCSKLRARIIASASLHFWRIRVGGLFLISVDHAILFGIEGAMLGIELFGSHS